MIDKMPDWLAGILFFGVALPLMVGAISGIFALLGYVFVPQGGSY